MKLINRLLAVLLALALLTLGVLVIVEIAWVLLFGGTQQVLLPYPAVTDYLAGLTWDSRPARAILIGAVILGGLLLLFELRRRKPGLVTLASSGGSVTSGADRRSLERAVAAAATDLDGIRTAVARVTSRRATVSAVAGPRDSTGLGERLTAHLQSWLDGAQLASPPALSVKVQQRRTE